MKNVTSYEPSAWMRDAIANRLREAGPALRMAGAMKTDAILLMLTDPPEDATDEERHLWETQCDRCGKQCQLGDDFHTGTVTPNAAHGKLNITFGLCNDCKEREVGGE